MQCFRCRRLAVESTKFYFLPSLLSFSTLCTDCRTRSFSLLRQHGRHAQLPAVLAQPAISGQEHADKRAMLHLTPPARKHTGACFNFAFLREMQNCAARPRFAHDGARAHTLRRSAPDAPRPPAHAG
jgi:hypothetical protein